MNVKGEVRFEGAVFNVHVTLGAFEAPLSQHGNTWSWRGTFDTAQPRLVVRMRPVALDFTDWSLLVRLNGTKVVEEEGTFPEDGNPFAQEVDVPPAASAVVATGAADLEAHNTIGDADDNDQEDAALSGDVSEEVSEDGDEGDGQRQ